VTGKCAAQSVRLGTVVCDNCRQDFLPPENQFISDNRKQFLCDYCRTEEESCGCADPD